MSENRFDAWATFDLSGQCRMQAKEQLDPEFSEFMLAVASRLDFLASHPAGQSAGSGAEAFSGKFWLHLREPRRVPERKGPFRSRDLAKTLREFMEARPQAYISVVTVDYDGPEFEDGPQALQATDGRSMSTGSRHIQRVRAAHGDHSDLTAPDSTRTGQGEAGKADAAWAYAVETWGEAWVLNEIGGLTQYARLAAPALAARPAAPEAQGVWRVRHVKRGTEYEVLGEAEAQVSVGMTLEEKMLFIHEGDKLTVYRDADGKLWCRFTDEFRDGRFEPAPPTSSDREG